MTVENKTIQIKTTKENEQNEEEGSRSHYTRASLFYLNFLVVFLIFYCYSFYTSVVIICHSRIITKITYKEPSSSDSKDEVEQEEAQAKHVHCT